MPTRAHRAQDKAVGGVGGVGDNWRGRWSFTMRKGEGRKESRVRTARGVRERRCKASSCVLEVLRV